MLIPYFYNNANYVGSTIFVKVNFAVSSANQKCIYVYILPFYPFLWAKYFVFQYTDCRFLRLECQGILKEGWSQRYNEAIRNFHYSSNCIR